MRLNSMNGFCRAKHSNSIQITAQQRHEDKRQSANMIKVRVSQKNVERRTPNRFLYAKEPGPGIKGNTVFGASTNTGMGVTKWNFANGALNAASGNVIRPPDVHATLLKSMGLSFGHISNQSPVPIDALIK